MGSDLTASHGDRQTNQAALTLSLADYWGARLERCLHAPRHVGAGMVSSTAPRCWSTGLILGNPGSDYAKAWSVHGTVSTPISMVDDATWHTHPRQLDLRYPELAANAGGGTAPSGAVRRRALHQEEDGDRRPAVPPGGEGSWLISGGTSHSTRPTPRLQRTSQQHVALAMDIPTTAWARALTRPRDYTQYYVRDLNMGFA